MPYINRQSLFIHKEQVVLTDTNITLKLKKVNSFYKIRNYH